MVNNDNVGVAFAVCIAAGLATTIGSTAAFFAVLRNRLLLAGGLGVAAGVMLCKYLGLVHVYFV